MLNPLHPPHPDPRTHIQNALGVPFVRIARWLSDPPTFSLWIGETEVKISGAETLMSQSKTRAAIYGATKLLPTTLVPGEWDRVLVSLGQLMEDLEVSDG